MRYIHKARKTQGLRERKHISQMSRTERDFLSKEIKKISSIKLCEHAKESADKIKVPPKYIISIDLKRTSIIEYNTGRGYDRRVVLRDKRVIYNTRGEAVNLVLVVDLDTHVVVTVYVNRITDNHSSLNLRYYNKDLKII